MHYFFHNINESSMSILDYNPQFSPVPTITSEEMLTKGVVASGALQ
jgi:hypothetical protein